MHRIDADAHVSNAFSDGDAGIGQPGTRVDAAWLNAIQEELAGFIESRGITLNKASHGQLTAAVAAAIEARFPAPTWTLLTLGANWTAGSEPPAYWKDHAGIVHLKGWATSTSTTGLFSPVGALPVGSRPLTMAKHSVSLDRGGGPVAQSMWVYPDGSLSPASMQVGDVCHLNSVSFPAEQ